MNEAKFPEHFLWGCATSSYQIEGATTRHGRHPSIWDTFCAYPGKVADGATGDVACDHYNRMEEDVALMKQLGIDIYRFSISWPRVLTMDGELNRQGIEFYKRLLATLKRNGIKACATLFHWDLPQHLQDIGGWMNREVVAKFVNYAEKMFRELDDDVHQWITINEPSVISVLGYINGIHAPGIRDLKKAMRVSHHLMVAHALAVRKYRELGLTGEIGITLNFNHYEPYDKDNPNDVVVSNRMDALWNRQYLDLLFRARYPEDLLAWLAEKDAVPEMEEGDLQLISEKIDFLGVNYYSRNKQKYDPEQDGILETYTRNDADANVNALNWEIYPEGLYHEIVRVHEQYRQLPVYITENGGAFTDDVLSRDGQIHDRQRIDYLQSHFAEAKKMIDDGVDLRGYYVWSLLDNFEWHMGYGPRFGLFYVDYDSQARIWKDSAKWYKAFIRAQKGN